MSEQRRNWQPVPNACSTWTREQNFAYRLKEALHRAFCAGGRYGAQNPAVFERKPLALSLAEYRELPNFVGDEFKMWASREAGSLGMVFGLSPEVQDGYFPRPCEEPADAGVNGGGV
jgi:hypothetical protein